MSSWKQIADAPLNRPVLLFEPYYMVRVGRWMPREIAAVAGVDLAEGQDGLWMTDLPYGSERGEIEMELRPTHWAEIPLPLPEASE